MTGTVADPAVAGTPAVVGRVEAHVKYGDNELTSLKRFVHVGTNRFKASDEQLFVSTNSLKGGLVYKKEEDQRILVAPQSCYVA